MELSTMEFDLENPFPFSHENFHAESITTLFHTESDHMPSSNFDVSIRQQTLPLISHLSLDFDPCLSYLAINYMDRFLSSQSIPDGKPWMLRLTAVSCISLALKMTKTEFSVTDIQQDGGLIFDSQTIEKMEVLILGALKWRMRSITPFSFINFFISFFKFKDPPFVNALKARAIEIIHKAQHEVSLLKFRPSLISASALLCSSHELFPLQFPCYRNAISSSSFVHKDNLLSCYNMMQEIAMEGYESVLDLVSSSSTPVNVLDLQCWSTSSSSDTDQAFNGDPHQAVRNPMETSTTQMRDPNPKRRKIGGFSSRSDDTVQLSQIQQG